jgi:hypothetical protein
MPQKQSNREQKLQREARVLVKRLGHGDNPDPGAVQEAYNALAHAEQGGYRRGHDEGHKHGWEDHGREKGCNCS